MKYKIAFIVMFLSLSVLAQNDQKIADFEYAISKNKIKTETMAMPGYENFSAQYNTVNEVHDLDFVYDRNTFSTKKEMKIKSNQSLDKAEFNTLYRIQIYKILDGRKSEFIETHQRLENGEFFNSWSVRAPFFAKKITGDLWDLMTIHPMISYGKYFNEESLKNRREAHGLFSHDIEHLINLTDFEEDLFSVGPDVETLKNLFAVNSYYNVTAINSKAGKVQSILATVDKWNNSRVDLGLPKIIPFFVEAGSDIDVLLFTFYPNLEASILEFHSSLETKSDEAENLDDFESYDAIQMELAKNSLKTVSTMNEIISEKVTDK